MISDSPQFGMDSLGGSGHSFQKRSKLVVSFGYDDSSVCLLSSPLIGAAVYKLTEFVLVNAQEIFHLMRLQHLQFLR